MERLLWNHAQADRPRVLSILTGGDAAQLCFGLAALYLLAIILGH
jgi:hypothetical protein